MRKNIFLSTIKNYPIIKNEISSIYKEWQYLKIQYAFGNLDCQDPKYIWPLHDWRLDKDSEFIIVNENYTGAANLEFPVSWIWSKNWRKEAIADLKQLKAEILIEKLQR